MDKPCVYVSGPMSGHKDWNFTAFNEAAANLINLGYGVINPACFGAKSGETWESCLKRDLTVLVHCDIVAVLDGWERSKGARLEVHVANELGIKVVPVSQLLGG